MINASNAAERMLGIASVRTRDMHGKAGPAEDVRAPSTSVNSLGLRERKKARLRQQIIETAIRLFRERGYEDTRVDDIVQVLEISQPTFFRYFPSKDAVLRDIALRGIECVTEQLRAGLATDTTTAERLRKSYCTMARYVEADRALWQAVVLSGAMDPVRSPEIRHRPPRRVRPRLRAADPVLQRDGEYPRRHPVPPRAATGGVLTGRSG